MKFTIYEEDGKRMIRRNVSPRFIGEITFGTLSDIENVQFLDDLPSVMDAARAMREAGDFLVETSKIKNHEK